MKNYIFIIIVLNSVFSFGQDIDIVGEIERQGLEIKERLFRSEGKIGLIDSTDQVLIPAEYDTIKFNSDHGYECYKNESFILYSVELEKIANCSKLTNIEWLKEGKNFFPFYKVTTVEGIGLLDDNYNLIIPPKYDEIYFKDVDSYCKIFVVEKNGKKGMYCNDNLIHEVVYDEIEEHKKSEAFFFSKAGKKGLFYTTHSNGVVNVMPVKYESLELKLIDFDESRNGYFEIEANKKKGIIKMTPEEDISLGFLQIIPPDFDEIRFKKRKEISSNYYIVDVKKGKIKGHVLLFDYIEAETIFCTGFKTDKDNVFYKTEKGKWGMVSASGWDGLKEQIPAEYEKVLIPGEYKNELVLDSKLLAVQKNGKWGLITYDNEVMAEIKYDKISEIEFKN